MKTVQQLFAATLVLLLTACSSLGGSSTLEPPLTAVNYTDWPFDWVGVATVAEPEKAIAADRVTAFGASGIMCCVSLPRKWQPGLQLVVQTRDGTRAKTSAEWSKENLPLVLHLVDVPPYQPEDAGTVWVQLLPAGKVNLVVSSYNPSHALWPGEVKGWPVPTVEFRRKIWDRDYAEYMRRVKRFSEAAQQSSDPNEAKKFAEAADWALQQAKKMEPRP